MSDAVPLGAEAAANAFLYAAILLAVGVCTTRWWLRLDVRSSLSDATVEQLEIGLARLGLRVAAAVVVALGACVWGHTISTFGWSESLSWDAILLVGLQSRWGKAWQVQLAAALVLLAASFWIRIDRPSGWMAASLASVAVCATLPLVGHAAGSPGRVLLHSLHVLGAGMWLGTLAVVILLSRGRITSHPPGDAFLPRFAPIAASGAVTLVVAGVVTAYLYVGQLSNLWTTVYGRVLSAKIVLFAGVGFCGWLNWRQYSDGAARRRVLPLIEICLTAVVVILTGLLTQLARP